MENSIEILRQYNIGVRLDFTTLRPENFSEAILKPVWEKHADMLRQNGEVYLPCSVHLQDWDRLMAFFEGLDRVSKESLDNMKDRTIVLNGPNLGLCTASPYTAAAIRKGYTLEVPPPQFPGDMYCQPILKSEVHVAEVKATIVEIRKRIKEYTVLMEEAEYKLENEIGLKSTAIENMSRAKRMRFISALAWQLNAQALDDAQDLAAATEAVNAYIVHTNYIVHPDWA